MSKKSRELLSQVAERKLEEIVSGKNRERIMNLLEEEEHGFITKEGEEYVTETIKKEGEKDSYILKKSNGEDANYWNSDCGYEYQFEVAAFYEDRTKKQIRIFVSVDQPEGSILFPVSADTILNSHDLSIYELPKYDDGDRKFKPKKKNRKATARKIAKDKIKEIISGLGYKQ